jgi:hypothetical protein
VSRVHGEDEILYSQVLRAIQLSLATQLGKSVCLLTPTGAHFQRQHDILFVWLHLFSELGPKKKNKKKLSAHPGKIRPAVNRPPSAVRRPPSAVRRPPSAVRLPPSAVRHPPSAGLSIMHMPAA